MLADAGRPIGGFDERATLLVPPTDLDAVGQPLASPWTEADTLWCRAVPLRSLERFTAQQVIGKAMLTVELREYRDGVTTKHRLRFRGKDWNILDARQVGRREGLELDCTLRDDA